MELKAGYQQTEVGMMPEDWRLETMLSVSQQLMDFRGRTPKKLGLEWGGGDIPALSAGNVKAGYIDFEAECYYGSEVLYRKWMTRGDVQKDDILFTTEAPLGNAALVPDDRQYILSQRTILLQIDAEMATSRFVFQYLLSDAFQTLLADYSSGSTAKGIQRKKFEQLNIPLPPTKAEQEAIAEALSDADALIESLEQLTAKKRQIKQGAMQELLTGKKRLPGFTGEWDVTTLGSLGLFAKGSGVRKDEAKSGTLPCVRYGEIYTLHNDYVKNYASHISTAVALTAVRLRKGDLLFAGSGETREEIGKCVAFLDDIEAYAGGDIVILRPKAVDSQFFGYLLNTPDVVDQKASKGQGDAVVHISASALGSVVVTIPNEPEQIAIAEILSDMDAEIAGLVTKLAKARQVKQGMMQELLTGNIRLIQPEKAHA